MLSLNIKTMVKKHALFTAMLIITQIVAMILMLFSYGVYQNNLYEKMAVTNKTKTICVVFKSKSNVSAIRKIKEAFPAAGKELNDSLEAISLWSVIDEKLFLNENGVEALAYGDNSYGTDGRIIFYSMPYIKKGKYSASERFEEMCDSTEEKIWFEDEDYKSGNRSCIIGFKNPELEEDGIIINGLRYNIKAHSESGETITVLPGDFPEYDSGRFQFTLFYGKQLLKSEYERDLDYINRLFNTEEIREISDYVTIDIENKATWQSMMLISLIMGAVSTLVICLIYRFMQKERQKNTAIYELCGCTRGKATAIFLGEVFLFFILSGTAAVIIYKTLVVKVSSKYYLWIKEISSWNNLLKLIAVFSAFVLVCVTLMVVITVRKPPKEVLRSKE